MTAYQFFIESGWGLALSIFALISTVINIIQLIQARKTRLIILNVKTEPFGQPVRDLLGKSKMTVDIPHLTRFNIYMKNSGNVDLIPDDYIKPIELDFGTEVDYLEVTISNQQIIGNSINNKSNKIVLDPFLLKVKEELEISGFISSKDPIIESDPIARIKGFQIVNEEQERGRSSDLHFEISMLSMSILGACLFLIIKPFESEALNLGFEMSFVALTLLFIFRFVSMKKK